MLCRWHIAKKKNCSCIWLDSACLGWRATKRAMVKQGGHKQRRRGQAEKLPARSRSHVESPLALLLLKMWSTGELSGPALQEIAKAAADSGCQGQDIQRLAMLGAAGNSPQNIQRDLMALHFKDMKVPQVHTVETKISGKDRDGQKTLLQCQLPLLLPHEWMSLASIADTWLQNTQDV